MRNKQPEPQAPDADAFSRQAVAEAWRVVSAQLAEHFGYAGCLALIERGGDRDAIKSWQTTGVAVGVRSLRTLLRDWHQFGVEGDGPVGSRSKRLSEGGRAAMMAARQRLADVSDHGCIVVPINGPRRWAVVYWGSRPVVERSAREL